MNFADLALGAEIDVPTIDGTEKLNIPDCTQTGTMFTLKGKGVQVVNSQRRGNMYITVIAETPRSLNKKQRELLSQLRDSFDSSNHPKWEKFKRKFFK